MKYKKNRYFHSKNNARKASIDKANQSINLGPSEVDEEGIVSGEVTQDVSLPISGSIVVADDMVRKVTGLTFSLTSSNASSGETNTNIVSTTSNNVFDRTFIITKQTNIQRICYT